MTDPRHDREDRTAEDRTAEDRVSPDDIARAMAVYSADGQDDDATGGDVAAERMRVQQDPTYEETVTQP